MKTIKHILLLAVALVYTTGLSAQKDSDVLFSVADQPVTVGEFRYIYSKTNADQATFNKESVMEYLDLYQRFKLKVSRARAMGLDTITVLQRELDGYRRQLADNYLIDKQVTNKLVEALYQRQQTDIEFSHILLQFKGNPTERDASQLMARTKEMMQDVTPENFADKAKALSEDTYSKEKGGRIGFITAPFPRGLNALEGVLYDAPANTVLGPVRSGIGYHILIKHGSRTARGEIEVAHIMVRKPEGAKSPVPQPDKIQTALRALKDSTDFGRVAKLYSEDKKTNSSKGYIGFFGINRYEPAFENAAFALANDGDLTNIVETSAGWHIIKRISRKPVQPLADIRPLLEKKVKADARFADAQEQMILDLRDKFDVTIDEAAFGRYAATLADSTFLDFRWAPSAPSEKGAVLSFGDGTKMEMATLQEFFKKNNRKRVSLGRNSNSFTVANKLFKEWADAQIMDYAEGRLEKDYPSFAALMREYREGILLFEATKIEVWDKASEDTTGLKNYFAANREDYLFEERGEITTYNINVRSGINAQEVYDFAKDNSRKATVAKFGQSVLATTSTLSATEATKIGISKLKGGTQSEMTNNVKKSAASFVKVENVLPARKKELKEARGYIIADYQDQLEREWVEKLRKQFPIKVNKKALNKLIKS
jgi:peptidyl-prolyl cis-trans isomerase SurA